MNRDDVIRMAREAGFHCYNGCADGIDADLERFFQTAFAAGAAAEREAILQIGRDQWFKTQADFEEAIRARSNT